jgi:hypothetical protein
MIVSNEEESISLLTEGSTILQLDEETDEVFNHFSVEENDFASELCLAELISLTPEEHKTM